MHGRTGLGAAHERGRDGIWLGAGAVLEAVPGAAYTATDGTAGEVRGFRPNDRIRLTWHPPGWPHDSTVQVAVIRSARYRLGLHSPRSRDSRRSGNAPERLGELAPRDPRSARSMAIPRNRARADSRRLASSLAQKSVTESLYVQFSVTEQPHLYLRRVRAVVGVKQVTKVEVARSGGRLSLQRSEAFADGSGKPR